MKGRVANKSITNSICVQLGLTTFVFSNIFFSGFSILTLFFVISKFQIFLLVIWEFQITSVDCISVIKFYIQENTFARIILF